MRLVTYSMGLSLDGYVVDPEGSIDWTTPSEEVFAHHLAELRHTGVQLMGRRLYETMLYWETAEEEQELTDDEVEWARRWKALPKLVFSSTLTEVEGTSRLASGTLADEIARLRAEPGDGDIAVGGADLAAGAAALGLVDEYRMVVSPVLLGGGRPYFPSGNGRVDLDLVETRRFASGALFLRYQVRRAVEAAG